MNQFVNLPLTKYCHVYQPIIYRYIDEKYVEEFYREGKIRISSFKSFAKHEDEKFRDEYDGLGTVQTDIEGAKFTTGLSTMTSHLTGPDIRDTAFVLCGTIYKSSRFESKADTGVITIVNPVQFALSVAHSLRFFKHVSIGLCNYREHRSLPFQMKGLSLKDFVTTLPDTDEPVVTLGGPIQERIEREMGHKVDELFFLKTLEHAPEAEFRIVWVTTEIQDPSKGPVDFIDIICKDAINACEIPEKYRVK